MGVVIEGFKGLVDLEREYGTKEKGPELIDGVLSDTLDLIQWPFRVDFINLSVDRGKMDTFVTAIRMRIKTYLAPPVLP